MKRLIIILMCLGLLAGCATSNTCPPFPLPSEHVSKVLDDMGEKDQEVEYWLNDLLRLCQKLETCP
jgi:hypothetical protein